MNYLDIYNHYDLEIDFADGVYIYDKKGNKYIDTFSGIGVLALGHSHPEIINSIKSKLERYAHTSNYFLDEDTEEVSALLAENDQKVFYVNSGTEATELALKIIKKKVKDGKILYFSNSFHGRSLGALSVNGFPEIKDQFQPLIPNTVEAEFNNLESLRKTAAENPDIKAVFFEPLQGSGGVRPADKKFVEELKKLTAANNWIMAIDEVQAGLYRTAKKYSFQHYDLEADLITTAKALGGGLPLGAVIMAGEMREVLEPGDHGSTFAPNPLALRGAKVVLEKLENMESEIKDNGDYFYNELKNLDSDKVKEVRGIGLMLGLELKEELEDLRDKAENNGLLLNILKGKTIRFLPALNISKAEIDEIIEKLNNIL